MSDEHPIETWRDVPDFPGYQVSDIGHVRSCRLPGPNRRGGAIAKGCWRMLTLGNKREYSSVQIKSENGKNCNRSVHRLVLEAFVGPRPEGMECRHLDGDPSNNRLGNLQWGTPKENRQDMRVHQTTNRGERNGNARLCATQVREVYRRWRNGETPAKIARSLKISSGAIEGIVRHKTWRHITDGA
jgi:hypothetical protein